METFEQKTTEPKNGDLVVLNVENNGSMSFYDKDFTFYVSKSRDFIWIQINANIFSIGNAGEVKGIAYDSDAGVLYELDEKGVRKEGGFSFQVSSQEVANRIAALFIRYIAFREITEDKKEEERRTIDLSDKKVVSTNFDAKEHAYVDPGVQQKQAADQRATAEQKTKQKQEGRSSSAVFSVAVGAAAAIFLAGVITLFFNRDVLVRDMVETKEQRSHAASVNGPSSALSLQEQALNQQKSAVKLGQESSVPSATEWVPPRQ